MGQSIRWTAFVLAGLVVAAPFARAQDYGDEGVDDWGANEEEAPPAEPPVAPDEVAQSPEAQVSYDSFYSGLAPYGEWVQLPGYGRVFRPYANVVGTDFRPYVSGGRWVYTPYGWSFQSDLPIGWAVYHYGRWALDATYGWIWMPGLVWGPAWVDWRWGDGYVGWAPLPPAGWNAAVYDPYWSFVQVTFFVQPNFAVYVVPRARVRYVYEATRPIDVRIRYRGTAYCPGPAPRRVSEVAHVAIRPVPVRTGRFGHPVPVFTNRPVPVYRGGERVRPTPAYPTPGRHPSPEMDRAYPVRPNPAVRPMPERERVRPAPPTIRRPEPRPQFRRSPAMTAPAPQHERRAAAHPAPARRGGRR